jgi:hypothetical protein
MTKDKQLKNIPVGSVVLIQDKETDQQYQATVLSHNHSSHTKNTHTLFAFKKEQTYLDGSWKVSSLDHSYSYGMLTKEIPLLNGYSRALWCSDKEVSLIKIISSQSSFPFALFVGTSVIALLASSNLKPTSNHQKENSND